MKINDPQKIKTRDVAIGFLGWLGFHNLLFFIAVVISLILPSGFWWSLLVIMLFAIIAPIALFAKKRIWVCVGIVTAVFINIGLWVTLTDSEFFMTILPFPVGRLLVFFQLP
jgi:hypothetical protein